MRRIPCCACIFARRERAYALVDTKSDLDAQQKDAGPQLPPTRVVGVACFQWTRGPSTEQLKARQRWLRFEIDETDAALQQVREGMLKLLEEADRENDRRAHTPDQTAAVGSLV